MYDDEYIKALICKCGHIAELHLWEIQEVAEAITVKPLKLENFVHGYAISKCWSDLDQEGRCCQCEILDFEDGNNWSSLAERMRTRMEKTVQYRVKRLGIEP